LQGIGLGGLMRRGGVRGFLATARVCLTRLYCESPTAFAAHLT